MDRKTLSFIALAFSMIYGVTVGLLHPADSVVALGGLCVALLWMSVGVLGRDGERHRTRRDRV